MSKKILLVEDEAILAMVEAKMIQKHGFEVLTADKGEKAIEMVENDPEISLILMDIDLGSGIDGTEAAQEILKKRALPIVFLTSHSEEEYVKRVKKITNYGYVLKNSGEFVLIESINMAYNLFNAHKRTRDSEEKYKAAFMTSPDSVNINRLDGLYVDINEGFTALTGFTRDDVIGKTSREIDIWAIPEDRERLVKGLKEYGYVENLESSFRCKDGSLKTALMSAKLITLNDEPHILSITRDITHYREKEIQLREYTKRLELTMQSLERILDSIPEDIYIADVENYEILFMNEQMKRSFPEANVGEICYKAFRGITSPCEHCTNNVLFDEHGGSKDVIVWEGKNPLNENWYINYDKGIPWFNGRKVRLQIAADITKRKNLEILLQKQKEDYELIFNNSMDGILFTSPDGTIFSANPAACEILQTPKEDIIEKGRAGIVDTDDPRLAEAVEYRSKHGSFRGELRLKRKTGEVFPVELASRIFKTSSGEERTCIIFRDISEQKQREQDLLDAIKEKDFLMRELNHRVKNNLHMIASLINMKSHEAGKEGDFTDITNHIEAIRLVHDKLYSKENISHVDFRGYSQELLSSIFSTFTSQEIQVVDRVDDIQLPSKKVVPLGLIINEIATNAIKHGFSSEEAARFTIELKADDNTSQYILTLSNTGRPFPHEAQIENPTTLGLQLITSLVQQIDGTIDVQKSPYPIFTIRFPVE